MRRSGHMAACAAATVFLLIQLHSAAAAFIDLPLEHAFGSSDFSQAGTLKGDLDGQVRLLCFDVKKSMPLLEVLTHTLLQIQRVSRR